MAIPPPSDLDFGQCIQGAYDDSRGRIRVDAELTSTLIAPPGLEVAISDIDDSIKIGNGSGTYAQVTGANALKVDGSAVTQPISAVVLPLPSGASTSALQIIGNTSLSSIDSKLTSPLAVNQSGTWTTGRTWSLINTTDSVNIGNYPAVQTVSVNNFPATQAVTQSTSPWVISGTVTANAGTNLNTSNVTITSSVLPTGAATNSSLTTINSTLGSPFQVGGSIGNTTFASTQSGTWNINNISGVISLPTGASTSTNQLTQNASLASIDSKLTSPLTINPITFASPQHVIVDSGTITSNIGTTGGLALDSSLTTLNTTTSGLLTNTQLRATPVPVSGTFFQATQPISGTVVVSNFPATQPVSGTISTSDSFQTTTDTFTAPANGVTLDAHLAPLKIFSLQVVITGTVSVWDVRLEGSLDNVNFTQILQHTNSTGNGVTIYSGSLLSASLYFRSRCSGFTGLGGSSLNAIILGIQ